MNQEASPRLLYSTGTKLANTIDNEFYGGKHYVWCTDAFHCPAQAGTSDPRTIINRFLKQVLTSDHHQSEIYSNITGILRGAEEKFNAGVITCDQRELIRGIAATAWFSDFYPVLYIIYADKVMDRWEVVPPSQRASRSSVEYKIPDLKEGEYELIEFEPMLADLLNFKDTLVMYQAKEGASNE